jgi:hypothetical protein
MTTNPLYNRPGLQVVDWNENRSPQGTPGNVIASIFSQVVGDDDDNPRSARFVHVRMEPNSVPRLAHSHPGWTTTMILEGSIDIEGVIFTEGQMVVVGPDVIYGPLKPGPEGATFIEIFDDSGSQGIYWDADPELVAEYREKGWIPPE